MSICSNCGAQMKALFMSQYCPNDCDRPEGQRTFVVKRQVLAAPTAICLDMKVGSGLGELGVVNPEDTSAKSVLWERMILEHGRLGGTPSAVLYYKPFCPLIITPPLLAAGPSQLAKNHSMGPNRNLGRKLAVGERMEETTEDIIRELYNITGFHEYTGYNWKTVQLGESESVFDRISSALETDYDHWEEEIHGIPFCWPSTMDIDVIVNPEEHSEKRAARTTARYPNLSAVIYKEFA